MENTLLKRDIYYFYRSAMSVYSAKDILGTFKKYLYDNLKIYESYVKNIQKEISECYTDDEVKAYHKRCDDLCKGYAKKDKDGKAIILGSGGYDVSGEDRPQMQKEYATINKKYNTLGEKVLDQEFEGPKLKMIDKKYVPLRFQEYFKMVIA